MTHPYGTDPGQPPQGLGDPGTQGPQFIAPGAPAPYGPPPYGPPQYGPYGSPTYPTQPPPHPTAPYGQGNQASYAQSFPQPYGQTSPPPRGPQPPSRGKGAGSGAVMLAVVLAVVAVIAVGAYVTWQSAGPKPVTQATPTRPERATGQATSTPRATAPTASTPATVDCTGGDQVTTSLFVATVPAGWSCDGGDGDLSLSSTRDDAIWVQHAAGAGDAEDCQGQIDGLGTVTSLPEESWGGRTVRAYQAVDGGDIYGVRCVVVGPETWYLMYFPLDPRDDAVVRADVAKLMSGWVWK